MFRSALPVAVAFFQSCFQQTLRLDRPVFGSLRLAPFFLALLVPFYMFGSYYVFGISWSILPQEAPQFPFAPLGCLMFPWLQR